MKAQFVVVDTSILIFMKSESAKKFTVAAVLEWSDGRKHRLSEC